MNKHKSYQFVEGTSFIMLGEEPIQNSTTQKMFAQIMQNKMAGQKNLNQSQQAVIEKSQKFPGK